MDCRVKPGNDNKEDSFVSTIKVLSAGAVQSMVEALGREFERASGNKLDLIFNTAGALRDRVKNGESADLVILSESIIASLDKSGMFVPGSIINLGRTATPVTVRPRLMMLPGTNMPDLSSEAMMDSDRMTRSALSPFLTRSRSAPAVLKMRSSLLPLARCATASRTAK